MTGNAGATAVFHFLFIFGASAPLYMSSRWATAKLHKNSEKNAVWGLFVCKCLKMSPLLHDEKGCFTKK